MRVRLAVLFFIWFSLSFTSLFSQVRYGNEWINPQQTYFKIPIAKKGLYRLTSAELRQAGVPISTVNPKQIQLFFRGEEQAIYIEGEADGRLDDADFIEFYGQANDGTQDSLLYIPHSAQPHKIYNLYSDTTAYFLTWRLDTQLGKRMGFYEEQNTANLTPEGYHLEDLWVSNIASYSYVGMSEGLIYPLGASVGAQHSYYDYGEGWSGVELYKNAVVTKKLTLENLLRNGTKPQLELHLMGRDHRQHLIEVKVGAGSVANKLLDTLRFNFQYSTLFRKDIDLSDVSVDSNYVSVSTVSRGVTPNQPDDVYSITYYRVRYAQRFDFGNKTQKSFYLLPSNTGKSYVEIPNASPQVRVFDVTDPNNLIRVGATFQNNTLKAIVRGTSSFKTLFATREILSVPRIERVRFRTIDPAKATYLLVTHQTLAAAAKQFAGYRASPSGGGYDTLTVDMGLLINQFNYGEFSPLAIRRFVQYMADKGNPRFLFIIGRTEQVDLNRSQSWRTTRDMVPTFGWPGSDNLFSHGLKGQAPLVAGIPTGRLWTASPQVVLDYLEKVKLHEATPMNALWRKNILHLSGGTDSFEQGQFLQIMNGFKQKAQQEYLGARVTTITKKTDEAVEYVGIANEVNEGAGLITLFGHSSLSVTDINIGNVSNDVLGFRNKGRYPLVYANGCVLGNFTFTENTFPIDWIGTKDRGAILFLAHSNLAFVYSLRDFANTFYDTFLGDTTFLNRPFGEVHQQVIRKTLAKYPNDPIYQVDAQQMSLQGDPAIILFPTKHPDYTLNSQGIGIRDKNGGAVGALSDSLKVQMVVSNFGIYRKENLPIRLLRTTRDGAVRVFDAVYPAVAYQDTLHMYIPHERTQSGLNRFEVVIDPEGTLPEMDKPNNTAAIEVTLPAVGAYPLFPAEYSIVSTAQNGQPQVQLVAQQIENTTRAYIFELDTTARFDSPYKKSQTVTAALLPSWSLPLLTRDSTTYYWRVRYGDVSSASDNVWSESSFTYIHNSGEGWTQRQAPQFVKATPLDLHLSVSSNPIWSFSSLSAPIKAVVAGNSVGGFNQGYRVSQLSISNILFVADGNCTTFQGPNAEANMVMTALRKDNLQAYSVMPQLNCGNPPYAMNTLRQANIISNQLFSRWLDAVPEGDWIVMMTVGAVQFNLWPASEMAKLVELGWTNENLAKLRNPSMFIFQKGGKKPALELSVDPNDVAPSLRTLSLDNYTLKSTKSRGSLVSSLIGPAKSWSSLKYQLKVLPQRHRASLQIIGVDLEGKETVLPLSQGAYSVDLSQVDATRFPFLRLKLDLEDNDLSEPLPAQLQNWAVNYTSVAEGAASANVNGIIEKQEGETMTVKVTFRNISKVAFQDSVIVHQTLFGPKGAPQVSERKLGRLLPNEEVGYDIVLPTIGRSGDNRLLVNFNPRRQPEQNYSNNVINLPIAVIPDQTPPVLDVVFDGQRIRNEEIVSANPLIVMQMKDENRFLFKNDTLGINVFLQRPNAPDFQRIAFDNNILKFTPANAQNLYTVSYRPGVLSDGLYRLRVQGADASSNPTGVYEIAFRVINEQKIVTVLTTPNPASSLVRFSFTVTGQQAPDKASLSITDINGRIIKEISIVPRIGVNEWIWEDAGAYPSGAYFYRLMVQKEGLELSLEEGVKVSGKLLLIR